MRAIIPVAGLGSRLKPHTNTRPKVLLNVGGRPMLGHIIDKLLEENITKATFVYGHLGGMVKAYISKNYPMITADYVEQTSLDGLGHAIYTALPTLDDEEIFIILGDTIFDVDLKQVFKNKTSSLGVKPVDDPRRFGVAIMKNGYIKDLIEKPLEPLSNLALVGLYYITNPKLLSEILNKMVKEDIRTQGEIQLTDALQMMIQQGEKMTTFQVEGWYDCGKPETLLATNRYLLSKRNTKHKNHSVVIIPPVYIAENAVVENSVIGPHTTISDSCTVKESIIKNSIIGANAVIEKSMLEDSIIGNDSNIQGNYKRLNTGDSTEIEFY